jgi:hypothetical protein
MGLIDTIIMVSLVIYIVSDIGVIRHSPFNVKPNIVTIIVSLLE